MPVMMLRVVDRKIEHFAKGQFAEKRMRKNQSIEFLFVKLFNIPAKRFYLLTKLFDNAVLFLEGDRVRPEGIRSATACRQRLAVAGDKFVVTGGRMVGLPEHCLQNKFRGL